MSVSEILIVIAIAVPTGFVLTAIGTLLEFSLRKKLPQRPAGEQIEEPSPAEAPSEPIPPSPAQLPAQAEAQVAPPTEAVGGCAALAATGPAGRRFQRRPNG